jgi:hypothetical protein
MEVKLHTFWTSIVKLHTVAALTPERDHGFGRLKLDIVVKRKIPTPAGNHTLTIQSVANLE